MKKYRVTTFLISFVLLLVFSSSRVLAEERSLFVGDLIEIKIESVEFTADELRDKFKDFEIVDLKDATDGYLITLRSFEVGEKTIQLGNKQVIITIKSTLDELKRDEVFEGDLSPQKAGFFVQWKYVFYILIIVVIFTGGFSLWLFLIRKKVTLLSSYRNFANKVDKISLDDRECFVKMTLFFKEYLEAKYSICISGKTSTEIISEIDYVSDLQLVLSDIQKWLKESDYYKFAGVVAPIDRKQILLNEIKELVRKIEENEG